MQYILTNNTITISDKDKTFTVDKSHPSFDEIVAALLNEDYDRAIDLCDVKKQVEWYTGGSVIIKDNTIWYNAEPLHGVVVDRILEFMRAGHDFTPLLNFLKKLVNNPSENSRNQLYDFLGHKGLPITPDGDFFAYKGVRQDYKDIWSGKFSNHIGATIQCKREDVVDNPDIHCAQGFHIGTYDYACGWASNGGRVVLVKVNPADAVSVPNDGNFRKLRVCKYSVIKNIENIVTQKEGIEW